MADQQHNPQPFAPSRRRVDAEMIRDYVALVLLIAGPVGVITTAFLYDPLLGAAVLFAAVTAAGVALGMRR